MKFILLLLFLPMYSMAFDISYSGADPLCQKSQNTSTAIELYKGDENRLYIAIAHDSSCTIKEDNPLLFYWKMGKKKSGDATPCEGLSGLELNFFNLTDLKILSPTEFTVNFEKILKLQTNFSNTHQVETVVHFRLDSDAIGCKAKAILVANNSPFEVNRVEALMRFLSLNRLTLFSETHPPLYFSK